MIIHKSCRGIVDPNNISNTVALSIKKSFLNSVDKGIINMGNDGIYKFNVFGFKLIVLYNNNKIIGIDLVDSVDQFKYKINNEYLLLLSEWKQIISEPVLIDILKRDFNLSYKFNTTGTIELNLENINLLKLLNYENQLFYPYNNYTHPEV